MGLRLKTCPAALWIGPLGQRLGEWPPKETTWSGLGARAISQPSHKLNDEAWHIYIQRLLVPIFMYLNKVKINLVTGFVRQHFTQWEQGLLAFCIPRNGRISPCY
ncbi:unnamed protein product [Schistosoma haematobium]|nr:unnamed protein product [Schistosoma haematobium]